MASRHFYICLLIAFLSINVCTILGKSHECYKVDGYKDGIPPGTYVGVVHLRSEKIGSIWFSNDTKSKCTCRFSNKHSIQNVTYYGMHIPDIQNLFDTGCHIVKNNTLEKPGYNCALNITVKNHTQDDISCTNIAIMGVPSSTTFKIPPERLTSPQSTYTAFSTRVSATAVKSSSGFPTQSSGSAGHLISTEPAVTTVVGGGATVSHLPATKSHTSPLSLTPVRLTAVTTNPTKHSSPYGLTSGKASSTRTISFSPETLSPSAGLSTDEHLEITTVKKTEKSSGLSLEIIIPLVLAVVFLIFIIIIFVCIRKQREKKRIFKYEVSPTPSLRLQESNSDREEILKYSNEFHEYGTKHNIIYEGDDYCEHGIFNKAFIETYPGTSKKKDDRVYAPTLEGHPEELVLEDEEPGTSTQYVITNDKDSIVPNE